MKTIKKTDGTITRQFRRVRDFGPAKARQRSLLLAPCVFAALSASAWSQVIYPVADGPREVSANSVATDPNGTWYGSGTDTYVGPVTGYWNTSIAALSTDSVTGNTIAGASTNAFRTNFLTVGDNTITDGNIELAASAQNTSTPTGPIDTSGNAMIDGRFQVEFAVSSPVEVELDQSSSSHSVTEQGIYSLGTDLTFSGPAVGTLHHTYASSAGPLTDDAEPTTEKFVLYPDGVYTFVVHAYANATADTTAGSSETPVESAKALWYLYTIGDGPIIGSYAPSSSSTTTSYNSAGSWSVVPNGACQIAYFPQAPVPQTISLDVPVTLGTVTIDSTNAYTINGPGTLNIYCPADGGHLNVLNGNHTINAQTTLNSNTIVDIVNASDSLIMTTLQPSSVDITKVDQGTWAVNTLKANSLTITGGIVQIIPQSAARNNTVTVSVLERLSISGSAGSWQGTLDLSNNDLILRNGSLGMITSLLASGYDSGHWNGSGISSTSAANDMAHLTAIGSMLNSNDTTAIYTMFDGQSATITDVLLKYTYYGDTNLDGMVDGSDYSRIDNGFVEGLSGWTNGDFNYDGVVDGSDYTLMDNAFDTQGASLATALPSASTMIQTTTVPEPSFSFWVIALSLTVMLRKTHSPGLRAQSGVVSHHL